MSTIANKKNNNKAEHMFYMYLADYLRPLFNNINDADIEKLKIASFEYFNFLLSFDALADGEQVDPKAFFAQLMKYEEAVKTLAGLFPEQDSFWTKFNAHKQTFIKTYSLEKKISADKLNIDDEMFVQIAKGKSSVCLAMADALASLAKNNTHTESLYSLLNDIHIGFQYLDDLDDFKKDVESGQHTYIICNLAKALKAHNIVFNEADDQNYKYLFLTGVAQQNLEGAIANFKKAQATATQLQLTTIAAYCTAQIDKAQGNLTFIEAQLNKTFVQTPDNINVA